jgi:hypothetical protein
LIAARRPYSLKTLQNSLNSLGDGSLADAAARVATLS